MGVMNRYCNQKAYLWSDKVSPEACASSSVQAFFEVTVALETGQLLGFFHFFPASTTEWAVDMKRWSGEKKKHFEWSLPSSLPFYIAPSTTLHTQCSGNLAFPRNKFIYSIPSSYICSRCIKMIKIVVCSIVSHLLNTEISSHPLKYSIKYLNIFFLYERDILDEAHWVLQVLNH